MQLRAVPALDLLASATVTLKHGVPDGHRLMVLDLKAPLKAGDRFPVTLTFERTGVHEVNVWLQTPRDGGLAHLQ